MKDFWRGFNGKVAGLALLVVLGSQVATLTAMLAYAKLEFESRIATELGRGTEILAQTTSQRARTLQQLLGTLVEYPNLRTLLGLGHYDEVIATIKDRTDWSPDSIALILSAQGELLASRGLDAGELRSFPGTNLRERSLLFAEKHVYELVAAPVQTAAGAYWIAIGIPVTDRLAEGIARMTYLEATLITLGDARSHSTVLGSSLPPDERWLLEAATARVSSGMDYKLAVNEVEKRFHSRQTYLLDDDQRVAVLLHKRVDEARAPFVAIRGNLINAVGISLLGALLMALLLSRAVTKPIQQLLQAARRMSVGNYSEPLEVRSQDEFGELASAFEAMRTGIAEREQRIIYQAEFDSLTGLPNRVQAMELLRRALREATQANDCVTVLMLHLQRFREIQSSLGHEVGDEVLRQTARRMRTVLGEQPVLARLEGDQFLVIASQTDRERARQLAARLAGAIDAGLSVQGVNVMLDTCIGYCVAPEQGRQPEELLRRAAVAKNDAQQLQKRICNYQNGREARHVRQLAILGDLRRAASENELQLFLQPKITLHDTRVCGAEALLRWDHPELGSIPPFEFIPLAEQAGCIDLITTWVLEKAIAQCRSWRDQGLHMPVAINLSAQDLLNEHLPSQIEYELDAFGMDAGCLILEITEEAVVRDMEQAIKVLTRLRSAGFRIAMDDFGTGYSSLSHLRHLPVDELKIDRAFVMQLPHDRQNAAIVRAIIDLAHNVGMEVVAEGVETTAALRWLREEGCERAQGYYLSKPMPAGNFIKWMRNWEQLEREDQNANVDPADSLILRPRLIT